MVCEKCEKKLGKVITPDTWKDGARNTTESGGRKLNENKLLTSKKARFDPYSKSGFAICRICKSSVHQSGSHYCQGCAYKKGICAMCGKKVLDTKNYKQTSVWRWQSVRTGFNTWERNVLSWHFPYMALWLLLLLNSFPFTSSMTLLFLCVEKQYSSHCKLLQFLIGKALLSHKTIIYHFLKPILQILSTDLHFWTM